MLFYRVSVIGFFLSLGGCAAVKTMALNDAESGRFKGKSLVYTQYSSLPDFPVQTALNVQFGLIGAAVAVDNGNDMIRARRVGDPALDIAKLLVSELSVRQGMHIAGNGGVMTASGDVGDLVKLYGSADYILDARTNNWGAAYYLSDLNNYKVRYSVQFRLIDRQSKSVLASDFCSHTPEYDDTDRAPSYKDLQHGDGIKGQLALSIEYCLDKFRRTLSLPMARA